MPFADATDIADRLGRDLEESEARIVTARLSDVELLIESRIPDLHQQVVDNKLNPRLVSMVESDVVLRLIRNPDGYTQETDGGYSYSINSSVASGRLEILPEEWALLGISNSVGVLSLKIRVPVPADWQRNPNYDFEGNPNTDEWDDSATWDDGTVWA